MGFFILSDTNMKGQRRELARWPSSRSNFSEKSWRNRRKFQCQNPNVKSISNALKTKGGQFVSFELWISFEFRTFTFDILLIKDPELPQPVEPFEEGKFFRGH